MKPITTIKTTLLFSFIISGTALAQNNTPAATVQDPKDFASTAPKAVASIATSVNVLSVINEQVAETKIQKRRRKKQDPILIPYRLNKKTMSLS